MEKELVYFDYNATTPLDKEVISAISESLRTSWANPSSGHTLGKQARLKIEEARSRLAKLVGANDSKEITFTSGGTEVGFYLPFIHLIYGTCTSY